MKLRLLNGRLTDGCNSERSHLSILTDRRKNSCLIYFERIISPSSSLFQRSEPFIVYGFYAFQLSKCTLSSIRGAYKPDFLDTSRRENLKSLEICNVVSGFLGVPIMIKALVKVSASTRGAGWLRFFVVSKEGLAKVITTFLYFLKSF